MSFFGTVTFNILAVLSVVVLCLYLYVTRHFSYWKKRGIPYVKPLPFFGNMKDAILQKFYAGTVLQHIYREYKHEPYVGIFAFDKPALLVNDLDLVKNIMVKDSQYFADHIFQIDEKINPLWAHNIFGLKGERWKHMRQKLSPTFTSGKMKMMFYLVDNCSKELVRLIDNISTAGTPVPVKETLTRYTTDAISTCALGIETNALKNPNSEVRNRMRNFFKFSIRRGIVTILMFFAPELCKMLKMRFMDDKITKFFRNTVWETVKYREQHGVVRKDLLDSLMELRKKAQEESGNGNADLEGDEFVAQAFVIFVAGFETSSSATTFMLYELAKRPEIQTRLRKEVCEVLQKHNNEVTYEAIHDMKYLDMVINETLRKYPVMGFVDRVCNSDYDLPSPSGKGVFTVKAGTGVYISVQGIHYNPEYFPDPEIFEPDRFTEENKLKRHNFTHFPFGEGPRICIGKRFGLMQIKTALSHVLPKYEVSLCKTTPQQITYETRSFTLQSKQEIPLTFKKINV